MSAAIKPQDKGEFMEGVVKRNPGETELHQKEYSMLHKFKITTCAFILCLFGLTLITVSPVFAEKSPEFIACQQMKWKDGKKAKKNCFRNLARDLEAAGAAAEVSKSAPLLMGDARKGTWEGDYFSKGAVNCYDRIPDFFGAPNTLNPDNGASGTAVRFAWMTHCTNAVMDEWERRD